MADRILAWIDTIAAFLWGPWTLWLLLGAGLLFTIWTKVCQFRVLRHGFHVVRGEYDNPDDPGAINHFQALSAALSATIGLGNIGGVAIAIAIGGPGSLVWMWIVGFLGMALKTVEITLAMLYRNTDDPEDPHGGAMWVIDRTLGARPGLRPLAKLLGGFFCVSCLIMTMAGGNMFQTWNVADLTNVYFDVPQVGTGIVLAIIVGLVIVGGIKRIGHVAGRLVPLMCALYILSAMAVLAVNVTELPAIIALIFTKAFSATDAAGAFVGGAAGLAFTKGMQRALFSNEAGLGSAPIAHSAAKTDQPAREGIVGGMGPFIDTIIICTVTALVIISTDTWNRPPQGPMGGEVRLEMVGGVPSLTAPTDADALPQLAAWERYNAGEQVFFIVVAEIARDDGSVLTRHVRWLGQIEADERGDPDRIAWEDWPTVRQREGIDEAAIVRSVRWSRLPDGSPMTGLFRDFKGASLTAHAFDRAFPGLGKYLVTIAAWLFAISTMISWSYYGEQATIYLFGARPVSIMTYKIVFLALAITGAAAIRTDRQLDALTNFGTGWMLWANMIIVLLMGFLAVRALDDYFRRLRAGEFKRHAGARLTDLVEGKDRDRPGRSDR